MSPDIRFTPSGIPYILEFENVSVVPDNPPSPSSSSSSFCYIDLPPPPPRRLPSLFKRKHAQPTMKEVTKPLPPPPAEPHGIFIQFPPERAYPHIAHKQRLVYLQQTISMAVRDAGMRCSPGNTTPSENHPSGDQSHQTRGYRSADALFCGTYGQMMTALEGAGLSATPCTAETLSAHTRLGALFVARNEGVSGVQLRKITLWG